MKTLLLCLTVLLLASATQCFAADKTYVINPPYNSQTDTLRSLDHGKYITWGINWALPNGEVLKSVTLEFSQLWNWTSPETNHLYVHLLNSATTGIVVKDDYDDGIDQFSGQGPLLADYQDPDGGTTKVNLSCPVLSSNFSWITDGSFGFGIDPDCHFYDCGVKCVITTTCVPEPGSFVAFACGLISLGGFVCRRRRVNN